MVKITREMFRVFDGTRAPSVAAVAQYHHLLVPGPATRLARGLVEPRLLKLLRDFLQPLLMLRETAAETCNKKQKV